MQRLDTAQIPKDHPDSHETHSSAQQQERSKNIHARNRSDAAERLVQLPTPNAATDAATVASRGQYMPNAGNISASRGTWLAPAIAPRKPHVLR